MNSSLQFGVNSTRNLFADSLQTTLTNIVSIFSTLTTFIGVYTILRARSRETLGHKYIQIIYHIILYLAQLFAGSALNMVLLFPTPAIYCIGWLRNVTDWGVIGFLTLFYFLFSFQGQLLAILLLAEIQIVARRDSVFKVHKFLAVLGLLCFVALNTAPHALGFILSYNPRPILLEYVEKSLPYHGFLARYPFLWISTSKKVYLFMIAVLFCSVGLIIFIILVAYIVVFYELERQVNTMSKKVASAHKQLIDEVMLHGKIIFPFFALIPAQMYAQFFVKEETDVSVPLAISFSIFTSAPIPAMLVFLYSNPTYKKFFVDIMLMNRRSTPIRVASVGSSNFLCT